MVQTPVAAEHEALFFQEPAMFQLLSRFSSRLLSRSLSKFPWIAPWCNSLGLQGPRPRRTATRRPPEPAGKVDGEREPVTPACGWFDSSHELEQGLMVCEHGNDSAGAAMATAMATAPLADWLDFELRGWRGADAQFQGAASPQA